jgi:hypothetical protein
VRGGARGCAEVASLQLGAAAAHPLLMHRHRALAVSAQARHATSAARAVSAHAGIRAAHPVGLTVVLIVRGGRRAAG